jgi:hypothetical protein
MTIRHRRGTAITHADVLEASRARVDHRFPRTGPIGCGHVDSDHQ